MTFNKDIKNSENLDLNIKTTSSMGSSDSIAEVSIDLVGDTGPCPIWNKVNENWEDVEYIWNLCDLFESDIPNVTVSANLDLIPSDSLAIDRFGTSSMGIDKAKPEKLDLAGIPSSSMSSNKITRTFYNDFFNNIEDKFDESDYYFGDVESGWQVAS